MSGKGQRGGDFNGIWFRPLIKCRNQTGERAPEEFSPISCASDGQPGQIRVNWEDRMLGPVNVTERNMGRWNERQQTKTGNEIKNAFPPRPIPLLNFCIWVVVFIIRELKRIPMKKSSGPPEFFNFSRFQRWVAAHITFGGGGCPTAFHTSRVGGPWMSSFLLLGVQQETTQLFSFFSKKVFHAASWRWW
jgi:hypothetical protein